MKTIHVVQDTVLRFTDFKPYNENEPRDTTLYITIGAGKRAYLVVPTLVQQPPADEMPPAAPETTFTVRIKPVLRDGETNTVIHLESSMIEVTVKPGEPEIVAPILLTPWANVAPIEVRVHIDHGFSAEEMAGNSFFIIIGDA